MMEIVIGGGSVAGLSAAREAARSGLDTEVIENDMDIGIPEKCGGLVSLDGLTKLGVPPTRRIIHNDIKEGRIVLPEAPLYEFNLRGARLIVLNRSEFDKELAAMAVKEGARISVGERIENTGPVDGGVQIKTNKRQLSSKLMINALGSAYYPNKRGLMPAFQDIIAVKDGYYDGIMVFINKDIIGNFFAWYIPMGDGFAKIGAGGVADNILGDRYFEKQLGRIGIKYQIIKRINASLVIGGYMKNEKGRILRIGDAAGQTKPTTAGGIVTGGMGGIIAGQVSKFALERGDFSGYARAYDQVYGKELRRQLILAQVYAMLNNKQLVRLMSMIKDENLEMDAMDFDFHSYIIKKLITSKEGAAIISSILPRLAFAQIKGIL